MTQTIVNAFAIVGVVSVALVLFAVLCIWHDWAKGWVTAMRGYKSKIEKADVTYEKLEELRRLMHKCKIRTTGGAAYIPAECVEDYIDSICLYAKHEIFDLPELSDSASGLSVLYHPIVGGGLSGKTSLTGLLEELRSESDQN